MNEASGNVAHRLKLARSFAGHSHATTAAEALKITASTYLGYENGSRGLSVGRAMEISKRLGVRWEWLLSGEGEMALATGSATANNVVTLSPYRSPEPERDDALRQTVVNIEALNAALKASRLSANRASELAECERSYVRDLIRGKLREPGAAKISRLASVLGIPLEALLSSSMPDAEALAADISTHGTNGSSDVVVPQQDEIEVYLGATGAVVIRAVGCTPDGEDQTISIRPENVDAVVAAMLRVKGETLA